MDYGVAGLLSLGYGVAGPLFAIRIRGSEERKFSLVGRLDQKLDLRLTRLRQAYGVAGPPCGDSNAGVVALQIRWRGRRLRFFNQCFDFRSQNLAGMKRRTERNFQRLWNVLYERLDFFSNPALAEFIKADARHAIAIDN